MYFEHLRGRVAALSCLLFVVACGGGTDGTGLYGRAGGSDPGQTGDARYEQSRQTSDFNSANAVEVSQDSSGAKARGSQVEATTRLRQSRPEMLRARVLSLGEPDVQKIQEIEQQNSQALTDVQPKAYLLGYVRALTSEIPLSDTSGQWTWNTTADGRRQAVLALSSVSAKGLRLGIRIGHLPSDASVKVYGDQALEGVFVNADLINQTVAANVSADSGSSQARTFWMPMTDGDTAYLAIELPGGVATSEVDVAVVAVGHATETSLGLVEKSLQAKSACPTTTPDATCTMPPAMNAVAQYDWILSGGGMASCTGSLIADRAGSANNYFLTANHCISTQQEASSMVLYWRYRSAACNSTTRNPNYVFTLGANLLFAQTEFTSNLRNPIGTDSALLSLQQAPPVGSLKAGWTAGRQSPGPTTLTSIHHPAAAVTPTQFMARRSDGRISAYGALMGASTMETSPTNTSMPMYEVNWTSGITEQGSSGAPFFLGATTNNPQIVAQLWGGNSSCGNPTGRDYFGRFDLGYQDGMINWLNPGYAVVFRFYRPGTGTHFFTGNVQERNQVRQNLASYNYEGATFLVAGSAANGATPVYRFFRPSAGVHFYTIDVAERNAVMLNSQYQYEGVAWYARPVANPIAGVTIPIYRFFRPSSGTHFYTASAAERDSIIANLSATFRYEGVAYHAWPYN